MCFGSYVCRNVVAAFCLMLFPRLRSESTQPELFTKDLRKTSEYLEPLLC